MTWFIEILAIAGDESIVQDVLQHAGYKISETNEENRRVKLLSHPKYESFQAANDIHLDSMSIERKLREFSRLESIKLGIQFGPVRSKNLHGSIHLYIFSNVSQKDGVKGEWREMPKPALSAEARKKRAEEAAAQETEQRNALVALLGAALENPTVLKVMELLNIEEPSLTDLGNIVELVQDACHGDVRRFASKAEITRFKRSINHPEVFGLTARHAVSSESPPPDPMTYDQARLFARRVGESWLASLKHDP